MNLVCLDFETRWDTKSGYTLSAMSPVEYIRDSRFGTFGAAINSHGKTHWVSGIDLERCFRSIHWETTVLLCQNTKFDGFTLAEKFGIYPAQYLDTKLMAKAVLGKTIKGFSLRDLAEFYSLEPKGIMKTDGLISLTPEEEKELAEYSIHDVDLTIKIYEKLFKDFPGSQYYYMDWCIRTFCKPQLELDTALLVETHNDETTRKEQIFNEIGIEKAIFSSNPRFAKLLESKGYEVPLKKSPRTDKMIPALDTKNEDFLAMLNSENEELRTLCEARVAAKSTLLETRSLKLANIGKTGRWAFDIELSGATQTHRFSGGNQAGGNPQNFTKNSALRRSIKAPADHKLIIGDFAQIEMRIVAYLSRDPELMRGIERGLDLYSEFASRYYKRQISRQNVAERAFGKAAILGLGYGMGAKKFMSVVKLQTGLALSYADAQKAVDLYRSEYYRVPLLWTKLGGSLPLVEHIWGGENFPVVFKKKSIFLPSGLKIQYPNLRKDENDDWVFDVWKTKKALEPVKLYGGKLLENISQALAGEICKEAMKPFGELCTGLVHDEIHLLVEDKDVDKYVQLLYTEMTRSPAWFPELKLDAEIKVGQSWGDAKPIDVKSLVGVCK